MTTTYVKSIATDFNGNLISSDLSDEITAETGITKMLSRIDTDDDVVHIVFEQALSGGEQTLLDAVITAHNPQPIIAYTETHTAYVKKDSYKDTEYRDISTYIYEGSKEIGTIKQILCVSYKDTTVTSYSIRIYDDTNNKTIVENTFTNDDKMCLSLTPISNIPTNRSIFTVQLKKTGGSSQAFVYVENIQFRI